MVKLLKDNDTNNNQITVMGKILTEPVYSHDVYGEGFYTFTIEARRLSEASDVLPITISERIIEREKFAAGVNIHVEGQIRSHNSYVESDGKSRLVLTVFARDFEFYEEESGDAEEARFSRKKNPNDVFLNGYICKPPVYRTTPFGREIADLLIAVNRSYNKSDYIPCIAWGRNARFSGKLSVGDNIRVWGRMQSRTYQKKLDDGEVLEKTAYEVSVSKLEAERFLREIDE